MTRLAWTILTAVGTSLGACGPTQSPLTGPQHVPSDTVMNLFVIGTLTNSTNMSLDTVTFQVRDRCLEVIWNSKSYTPIFIGPDANVVVEGPILRLPYLPVKLGEAYYVEGPLVPERIQSPSVGRCPAEGLLMRGVTPLTQVPQPASPPGRAR